MRRKGQTTCEIESNGLKQVQRILDVLGFSGTRTTIAQGFAFVLLNSNSANREVCATAIYMRDFFERKKSFLIIFYFHTCALK